VEQWTIYKVSRVPGKVVIRIHFTDFTGAIMFHCHIARTKTPR